MAEIEVGPLSQRLSDDEIVELCRGLEKLGAPQLPKAADDSHLPIGDRFDDDVLSEFMDRLDAHDMVAEIYLPVEFEGTVEVGKMRVGSSSVLLDVLEELKDELDIDADEDDDYDEDEEEEDEEDDDAILQAKLRHVWRLLYDGAQASVERSQPLLIHS